MAALAGWCRDHMAERGHECFHVAGNSLGGAIALWLALSGAADSACALSPAGFAEGLDRAYLHVSLSVNRAAAPANVRLAPVLGRPGAVRKVLFAQYVAHGDRVPLERLFDALRHLAGAEAFEDTRRHALTWRCPAVRGLPSPVTVAWAEHDRLLLRRRQAPRAQERLPSARHLLLYDCGHLPGLDDPAQTAAVIREAVGA